MQNFRVISQKRRGHLDFCALNVQKSRFPLVILRLLGFSVDSILGVKRDLNSGPTQSALRTFARNLVQTSIGAPGSGSSRKKKKKRKKGYGISYGNACLLLTSLQACDWSGHIFGDSASLGSFTNSLSPGSTVHGGQHDTKYVTFELLLHAAFIRG